MSKKINPPPSASFQPSTAPHSTLRPFGAGVDAFRDSALGTVQLGGL
ncbi:MAG: hypothetical protein ACK5IE_04065 [Bacteroidota bacterium]